MTNSQPVKYGQDYGPHEVPWGGWAAAAAGIVSDGFKTREAALEWMVETFAEEFNRAITFIADDPERWEAFDSGR